MNKQTSIVTLVLVVIFGASIYFTSTNSNNAANAAINAQNVAQGTQSAKWQYGRLFMVEGEQVSWIAGDIYLGQGTTTIQNLMAQLGGNPARPTTANLLDRIGSQGWELTWFNENESERVWLFKKRTN